MVTKKNKKVSMIGDIIHKQSNFFYTGKTKDIDFRKNELKKLKNIIKDYENEIMDALYDDLKKSKPESYISEIAFVYQEIDHAISKLGKWAKPKKVKTPLSLLPARSWTISEPYGQVLIIGPWNYPFQLIFAPLVGAIAAGNTVVVKPSELAPNTSNIITKIISKIFHPSFVYSAEGGIAITQSLLSEKFDYIFFTGGTGIGKIIMEAASKNLTPVTLELGGKSPAIVAENANIDSSARKVAWGKFLNSGQTCIAPDYLLVQNSVREEFINRIKFYINEFYGNDPKKSPDYSRVINIKHFKRIKDLLKDADVISGGIFDEKELYISPTLADNVPTDHPLMKEEIFGPVLPIIGYDNIEEAISIVRSMSKPLALYLYTLDRNLQDRLTVELSSGGLVINDVLVHISNYNLPFGGVGDSGMGAYHGKAGFDTFSHTKSVLKGSRFFDIPLRYPPYKNKIKYLRMLLR